jgi:hypothetical protein
MAKLLHALPGTQLTRRLAKEGRLHEGHDLMKVEQAADQCTLGCNFDTERPQGSARLIAALPGSTKKIADLPGRRVVSGA